MKQRTIPVLVFLGLFLAACTSVPKEYTQLALRRVPDAENQPILLRVDFGEVTIRQAEDDFVEVAGEALFPQDLQFEAGSVDGQVNIKILAQRKSSSPPLRLTIRIPANRQVKIETESASIRVQSYQGDLEIASISGKIAVEQSQGRIMARSNRGDVLVRESSGEIGIVGNYGLLTLENVRGEAAASNIIGNISFSGLIGAGDAARLETDHGSIAVNLEQDSDASVHINSTSGDVVCLVPEIDSTPRTCTGAIRSGAGDLSIRTVSGAVKLQYLP